ncbi:MAG: hypothetical protein ABEJ66_00935, partial [Candidatus Nanohaloarchaea archaeon]
TGRFQDIVSSFDYQAAKALEVMSGDSPTAASVVDWGVSRRDAERLIEDGIEEEVDPVERLDSVWNPPSDSYQENYSYMQLRSRDTARYAYYSQDMEHNDVYGYRPLLEYSYSLPVSQKKNRRLLQRIARGRVPDRVITKGASGWEFVSRQFRKTINSSREEYREKIERLSDRGYIDRDAALSLSDGGLPRDKGRVNQMLSMYLLERWMQLFIDREDPWRPV